MKRMLVGGSLILAVAGYITANAYAQAQVMENPGWILVGGGMVHTLAILAALYLYTRNFRYHYPFVRSWQVLLPGQAVSPSTKPWSG